MSQIKDNLTLAIRFKVLSKSIGRESHGVVQTCYARTLDAERKFLEAAMHYKSLSQIGSLSVHINSNSISSINSSSCTS
jgi:hypothetical protein